MSSIPAREGGGIKGGILYDSTPLTRLLFPAIIKSAASSLLLLLVVESSMSIALDVVLPILLNEGVTPIPIRLFRGGEVSPQATDEVGSENDNDKILNE